MEQVNLCACGCGTPVKTRGRKWAIGHASRVTPPTNHLLHGHGSNGRGRSPTFITWMNMLQRCRNPKNPNFPGYGGRGISVCDRWTAPNGDGFRNFLADMDEKPSRMHSIERKDNDGNYEPGNCEWATKQAQARNRRSTVITLAMVERLRSGDLKDMAPGPAAKVLGVRPSAVYQARLSKSWAA